MVETLPKLAAVLESRYPGVKVSAEMGEYHEGTRRRMETFVGLPSVLLGHGLLPKRSDREEHFSELVHASTFAKARVPTSKSRTSI